MGIKYFFSECVKSIVIILFAIIICFTLYMVLKAGFKETSQMVTTVATIETCEMEYTDSCYVYNVTYTYSINGTNYIGKQTLTEKLTIGKNYVCFYNSSDESESHIVIN